MLVLPTVEDRKFLVALNQLAANHSSATFGDPGKLVPSKAKRQLAFAYAAWTRWPELGGGDLNTIPVEEWRMSKVDVNSSFWVAGQQRYHAALRSYFDALRILGQQAASPSFVNENSLNLSTTRNELLGELGFHVVEDFVSIEEEAQLVDYWSGSGPVGPFGTYERTSGRRWYNYGPILPKVTHGTTKSFLTVIPAKLGTMPEVVHTQRLQKRIQECAERLFGTTSAADRGQNAHGRDHDFDQMYVNLYDAASGASIDFHHDNHTCMLGTIAGISLMSNCELHLRPLDAGILRPPLSLPLPRRSLYLMTGLSRWHLQHAIPRLRQDRLSLTFRTVDQSCARQQELWERSWDMLTPQEAENAVWPLVQPDGIEVHAVFSSLADVFFEPRDPNVSSDPGPAPRRSTVINRAEYAQLSPRCQGVAPTMFEFDSLSTQSIIEEKQHDRIVATDCRGSHTSSKMQRFYPNISLRTLDVLEVPEAETKKVVRHSYYPSSSFRA